jgi:hypothetical protein
VAIDNYLEYRKRCGERLSPTSLLFRDQFDKTDVLTINRPPLTQMLKFDSIGRIIGSKMRDAGIVSGIQGRFDPLTGKELFRSGQIRKGLQRCNGLRKFANT